MGKEKKRVVTDVEFDQLGRICHQLANPRKMEIVRYLHLARFATASVIVRKCGIKQPSVSRYLKALSNDVGLLSKERVGTSVIYQINKDVWHQVSVVIGKVSG